MPLSDEEKRARARERARKSRAKKKAERLAAEAAERDARDAASGTTIQDAVETALAAMKWLTPSDQASVAQARHLAKQVDLFEHEGQHDRMLSAHRALSRVLHDIGGTPVVRMQHELRSLKLAKGGTDGDQADEPAPAREGNVTSIKSKRPPKRSRA